jgi:hypothetical protein
MAIGIYFAPAAMTGEKYDECLKRLRQAGAQNPPGRTYHACFGPSDKLSVFDVWTSQKAFDKFGQTLMPILQQIGIDPGQPSVMEVRKVIVPPKAGRTSKPSPAKRAAHRQRARRAAKKPGARSR